MVLHFAFFNPPQQRNRPRQPAPGKNRRRRPGILVGVALCLAQVSPLVPLHFSPSELDWRPPGPPLNHLANHTRNELGCRVDSRGARGDPQPRSEIKKPQNEKSAAAGFEPSTSRIKAQPPYGLSCSPSCTATGDVSIHRRCITRGALR